VIAQNYFWQPSLGDLRKFSQLRLYYGFLRQEKMWPELESGTPAGSRAASRFTSLPDESQSIGFLSGQFF
jgi:hypothetical protein